MSRNGGIAPYRKGSEQAWSPRQDPKQVPLDRDALARQFDALDRDRDGTLNMEEWRRALGVLGGHREFALIASRWFSSPINPQR